jgi:hypothetical protein
MNQNSKFLINKWGKRIAAVEKATKSTLTLEKRAALANSLENTYDRIRAVEATNPGSIGQYKRYALDIVTATVPNLIAFDVMSVQAMDNRIGMINYIDYRYAKTKGQTKAGTVFNSSINKLASDPMYSSDVVEGEEFAASGTSYSLAWTPVIDGSVEAFDVDSTAGTSTPIAISALNTATGAVTLAAAPAGDKVMFNYVFNNEDIRSDGYSEAVGAGNYQTDDNFGLAAFTNVPEVEMKLNSLPVIAKARTMRSFWAFDAQYELQKEYGQDIETLLATQVTGELAHEIDSELTLGILNFANAGTPLAWSKTITPGISLVDHYDSFAAKLVEGSNQIFQMTRKVKANFMICGLGVANVVEIMRNFTSSGVTSVGPHFLGTLGNLKVFVNPDYPSDEFVLGYKGSNMFDAGAFYCPYMPVSSTDLIMDANFRGQRGWCTMYGKRFLNSSMYIRGKVTA